jgi:hypothetical protein
VPPSATTTPGPTPDSPAVAIARLGAVTGRNDSVSEWIDVHFNPATLQLQVSNELKDTQNNERKQYVAKANAKLTMELQFDTTDTGEDVTRTTQKLQAFISPPLNQQNQQQIPPPVVFFEWGRVKFKGVAESYKETIDFFSPNGVPLRSLVNLTLSRQDKVFDDAGAGAPQDAGSLNDDLALDAPAASAADVANAGESPGAARSLARANGQESLRFGTGAALTVSAAVTLKPPAAFSAGGGLGVGAGIGIGAGVGISGGAGIGISGGAGISGAPGIGVSGGIGIGASAPIGVGGKAGLSSLAGLPATEGAFAALRLSAPSGPSTARLNTSRLQPQVKSTALATDRNATFRVGGKATEGAAGLRADVGTSTRARGKLSFESS